MNLKAQLCASFCEGIEVQQVKAGLVVGTPFERGDGDRIGFYLVPGVDKRWRLEDDGMTVASLIASGVDIQSGERSADFKRMLSVSNVVFDPDSMLISSEWLEEKDISAASLRFVSLLLRLPELQMLHPDKISDTFREDVRNEISKYFGSERSLSWDAPVSPKLNDFQADAVLTDGNCQVAIFIATSDTRIYEAVMARALHKVDRSDVSIRFAAVLESERPKGISIKAQQRARNYLDAAPSFRGDALGAMARIADLIPKRNPISPLH